MELSAAGGRYREAEEEQNKESEERDLSLTESDYVLLRKVVINWYLQINILEKTNLYRWPESNKESQLKLIRNFYQ